MYQLSTQKLLSNGQYCNGVSHRLNGKISNERGKWKEIILKNKTYPIMITFNPSYLIRFPENKKYSWEDLKKIKQKILDLNIKI